MIKVGVVLAVHNRKAHTLQCLQLLHEQSYKEIQIVMVDDGSSDGTNEAVSSAFPKVHIIKGSGHWWWARSMNVGFHKALALGVDVVISMNNDTLFSTTLISELVQWHLETPTKVLGCLNTIEKDQSYVFFAGVRKISWWIAKEFKYIKAFNPLTESLKGIHPTVCLNGRGTLIPRTVFETIGFFDALHFPQYAADYDFALRAVKANFGCLINWDIRVSSAIEDTGKGRSFIRQSWGQFYKSFFNPYASTSIKMWWHYYRKHGGIVWPIGFVMQLLRLSLAFHKKRHLLTTLQ